METGDLADILGAGLNGLAFCTSRGVTSATGNKDSRLTQRITQPGHQMLATTLQITDMTMHAVCIKAANWRAMVLSGNQC